MEKRGQVTTFMIAGLIILLVIGSVFVVNQYILKTALEREAERAAQVPEQIKSVKEHFDSCLKLLTAEAVTLAGSQAGYIEMPEDNLPTNPERPFSSTLELSPGIEVPYWFYETANGIQTRQVPALEEIRKQLENYLILNIKSCTEILSDFAEQGYEFDVNYNIKSDVLIQDENVISKVTLPIKITTKGLTFNLDDYPIISNLEVPFGRMYKIAKNVQAEEDKTNFFEEKAFDAMVAFPEIPVSGTEFSCTKSVWKKQDVIRSMKSIISSNINAVRLKGAYEDPNPDNEYFDIDPGMSVANLQSSFLYSSRWPMVVDVFPSEGNIMKSDQLTQKFSDQVSGILSSVLCINNWHFVYDVKFPVLMSLIDPSALDGQGFSFQFANLIIIDNNQPKKNVFGTYDQPDFKFPICKYPLTNVSVYTFAANENGLLVPLSGVDIRYKCITTKCEIGITGESEEGSLTALFPQCLNGLVMGEKAGYYDAQQFASTNEPQVVSLILEPYKTKKISVKLIEKDDGTIRDPYDSETIIFELKNQDNDFSTSFVYPGNTEIDLIPGTYDVKSFIIGNSTWPITIRGQKIEKCVETPKNTIWGGLLKDRQCITTKIDDIVVNEVLKGGADFTWDLTREGLYQKDSIIFYSMADHIPGTYESLNLLYSSISKNAGSKYFKEPE